MANIFLKTCSYVPDVYKNTVTVWLKNQNWLMIPRFLVLQNANT